MGCCCAGEAGVAAGGAVEVDFLVFLALVGVGEGGEHHVADSAGRGG